MQVLNDNILQSLKQGQTLVIDNTGVLRPATGMEKFIRWFNWREAKKQNLHVTDWLIKHMNQAQSSPGYAKTIEAISKYVKIVKKSDEAFKRLDNAAFAHKCCSKIPSLNVNELINKNGTPTNKLLNFIKLNSLHYIIPKVNPIHKETSFLFYGGQVYVRSKEGSNFLNSAREIDIILKKLPNTHQDYKPLQDLRGLLTKFSLDSKKKIDELRAQLEPSHYIYIPLQNIRLDKKGLLVSQSYMADGIEDFEHSRWTSLKPNFRETSKKATYKLRIVTHLPPYALKKTWLSSIRVFLSHLFDFRAHGHTWIELVEPIRNKEGEFTHQQNIYNMGYYFHPLNRLKRFESADPRSCMPIPSNEIETHEFEISLSQYEKAKLYIEEVQQMIKNPKRTLYDVPQNKNLTKNQIEDIQYLYKSTLKNTCLGFANTLKQLTTGIQSDHRSNLRIWLDPKKRFKKWDRFDKFIEKSVVLSWIIGVPRFFLRMELPVWVQRKPKKSGCQSGQCKI